MATAGGDIVNLECPDGLYSKLYIGRELREADGRPLYGDAQAYPPNADSCISSDEVLKLVDEYVMPKRQQIDATNENTDQNKVVIDEWVSQTYLAIGNPKQRLLRILSDNCSERIERQVELDFKKVPGAVTSPAPAPQTTTNYNGGGSAQVFGYLSSPLVGDVASIAKNLQTRYSEMRDNGFTVIPAPSDEFYGKKGEPVSLGGALEDAYHNAWNEAYKDTVSDYVYDYEQAILQRCGGAPSTSVPSVPVG